jgi:hypothetical protein
MGGAIPPLPQYAFMAWCSVKARGQLYLYLRISNLGCYVHKVEHVIYAGHVVILGLNKTLQ